MFRPFLVKRIAPFSVWLTTALLLTIPNVLSANQSDITEPASVNLAQQQDKAFRQALYYYFLQQPSRALQQLDYNRYRLVEGNAQSALFEAGLQISLGLPQQAQLTLQHLLVDYQSIETDKAAAESDIEGVNFLPEQDVLVIALLQLAEQKHQQGDQPQAMQLLTQIKHMPSVYYAQYQLVSQLVYWPEQPPLTAKRINKADQPITDTPFIQLNRALQLMEKQDYSQASQLLEQVKNFHAATPTDDFWLALFNDNDADKNRLLSAKESQALSDYARLLLAQNHVIQAQYQQAYTLLSDFPEKSAYGKQALFLYAYAALNAKNYAQAKNIFSVLTQLYPYSDLAWQTMGLLARQYNEQDKYEHALSQYLTIEQRYQTLAHELNVFAQAFIQQPDLLVYAQPAKAEEVPQGKAQVQLSTFSLVSQQGFKTAQPWLKKALQDEGLSRLFQQLLDLKALRQQLQAQTIKHQTFQYTLELNQQRKQQLVAQQQQANFTEQLAALSAIAKQAEQQLTQATLKQDGVAFADKTERAWLERIQRSEQLLADIAKHKKPNQLVDYQQRLARVSGVLAWQLKLKNSERQWQQQSEFNQIKQLIALTQQQLERVQTLLVNDRTLTPLQQRYQQAQQKNMRLLAQADTLTKDTQQLIVQKMQRFFTAQQQTLAHHLLVTKRAMAKVIEAEKVRSKNTRLTSDKREAIL